MSCPLIQKWQSPTQWSHLTSRKEWERMQRTTPQLCMRDCKSVYKTTTCVRFFHHCFHHFIGPGPGPVDGHAFHVFFGIERLGLYIINVCNLNIIISDGYITLKKRLITYMINIGTWLILQSKLSLCKTCLHTARFLLVDFVG